VWRIQTSLQPQGSIRGRQLSKEERNWGDWGAGREVGGWRKGSGQRRLYGERRRMWSLGESSSSWLGASLAADADVTRRISERLVHFQETLCAQKRHSAELVMATIGPIRARPRRVLSSRQRSPTDRPVIHPHARLQFHRSAPERASPAPPQRTSTTSGNPRLCAGVVQLHRATRPRRSSSASPPLASPSPDVGIA
jgi:hypothetical protein